MSKPAKGKTHNEVPEEVVPDHGKILRDAEAAVKASVVDHTLTPERIAYFNQEYSAENAHVVVQVLPEKEEITKAGIVKKSAKREQRAMVILAGPGEWSGGAFQPVTQKPGQIVCVTKYGGTDVELEDVEFLIVHTKQIYITKKKGVSVANDAHRPQ